MTAVADGMSGPILVSSLGFIKLSVQSVALLGFSPGDWIGLEKGQAFWGISSSYSD